MWDSSIVGLLGKAALLCAALSSCYEPNLGETPVRCAKSGKVCPDGYHCDPHDVCVRELPPPDSGPPVFRDLFLLPSKEGPVYLDGNLPRDVAGCIDAHLEPNNTAATAHLLTVPGPYPGMEICYPGDVDHFAVDLAEAKAKLIVEVRFLHENGDLELALLDPEGKVIATSRSRSDGEQLSIEAAQTGRHVIAVYGFGAATNVYDLDVTF